MKKNGLAREEYRVGGNKGAGQLTSLLSYFTPGLVVMKGRERRGRSEEKEKEVVDEGVVKGVMERVREE